MSFFSEYGKDIYKREKDENKNAFNKLPFVEKKELLYKSFKGFTHFGREDEYKEKLKEVLEKVDNFGLALGLKDTELKKVYYTAKKLIKDLEIDKFKEILDKFSIFKNESFLIVFLSNFKINNFDEFVKLLNNSNLNFLKNFSSYEVKKAVLFLFLYKKFNLDVETAKYVFDLLEKDKDFRRDLFTFLRYSNKLDSNVKKVFYEFVVNYDVVRTFGFDVSTSYSYIQLKDIVYLLINDFNYFYIKEHLIKLYNLLKYKIKKFDKVEDFKSFLIFIKNFFASNRFIYIYEKISELDKRNSDGNEFVKQIDSIFNDTDNLKEKLSLVSEALQYLYFTFPDIDNFKKFLESEKFFNFLIIKRAYNLVKEKFSKSCIMKILDNFTDIDRKILLDNLRYNLKLNIERFFSKRCNKV